jgi:hypothetical protein
MGQRVLLSGVVALGGLLHGEEVLIGDYLPEHDVLVVIVQLVLLALLRRVRVLHVLEALPLEEDVQLVVLDLHDVRTLAVDQDDPVA